MPIRFVTTSQPTYGSEEDEFLIGFKPSGSASGTEDNTIYGNGGDDWILADANDVRAVRSDILNGSISSAQYLSNFSPQTSSWSTAENPLFGSQRDPHLTVIVETTVGQSEYFGVYANADQQITIDIDFGSNTLIGNPHALIVELLDGAGNHIASSSVSRVDDGGLGSFPIYEGSPFSADPYLVYPVEATGSYFVNVRPADGGPGATFTEVNTFIMNLTVTGHITQSNPMPGEDIIDGGAGDDALFGGGGDDKILGGLGNDLIDGGSGADDIYGGDGNDIIYGGGDGILEGDVWDSDRIYGGEGDDILRGGGGTDLLQGGAGADILDGGAGLNDEADYSDKTAAVLVVLDGARDSMVFVDGVAEDTIRNIENVQGGSGNDVLVGDGQANELRGLDGNDVLRGGAGNDVLDGGAGTWDWVDYADKTAAISVTLNGASGATVTVGGGAEDTIRNIENVQGGSGNDVLVGDDQANELRGLDGDDALSGGSGNDVLIGGAGVDQFLFNTTLDALTNIDLIADFNVIEDTIQLDSTIFAALTGLGTLKVGQFVANASGTAQDADDRIIYETDTGNLYYDINGSIDGGSTLFARIDPALRLSNEDFFVV